jgi:hypothetical protein
MLPIQRYSTFASYLWLSLVHVVLQVESILKEFNWQALHPRSVKYKRARQKANQFISSYQ